MDMHKKKELFVEIYSLKLLAKATGLNRQGKMLDFRPGNFCQNFLPGTFCQLPARAGRSKHSIGIMRVNKPAEI